MRKLRYIFVFTLIIGLLLVSQTGCLLFAVGAAAGGTGAGVMYATGDLETTLDAPPKAVADATESAFKDLELVVIQKESSSIDAKITGRTARDVKMTVVIRGESEKLSRVSIRTGTFGDDPLQARVLEKIREHLGMIPSTQPTNLART